MKTIERLMLIGMLLAMASVGGAALPEYVEDEPFPSLAPLVEQVTPAVVNIPDPALSLMPAAAIF